MLLLALAILTTGAAHARDAGILYEVWHARAADAMRTVRDKGGVQLTTELVIQSAGAQTLDNVYGPYGVNADIFNVQPFLGFYCLYRARPGDVPPYVPNPPLRDCENITHTAQTHAAMLLAAGFDYVAVDVTNWPRFDWATDRGSSTDVAVIRPTEVLFEEWAALRARGIQTPSIAPWVCSPGDGTTWKYFLDRVYNNPATGRLLYKRPSGKLAFFIPDTPTCRDAGVQAAIEANGGLNNIEAIPMWALFGKSAYDQGSWSFFSPCTTEDGAYTTSMVGVDSCNQLPTLHNGTIAEVTASGGYMVSQCALPFASPGHLRGLTMARLFERVLAVGAQDLFVSSFNEHIGGRQAPASGAKIAFNMGLPADPQRFSVWVDTYGAEFSRDVEPTVEGGDKMWRVTASCVQMYKRGETCGSAPLSELCCSRSDKAIFANAWSMAAAGRGDYIVTSDTAERVSLLARGYAELCSAIPNPSAFCINTSEPDGRHGPFMLYNTRDVGLDTTALYRCIDTKSRTHFLSADAACEGQQLETIVGYGAAAPGREMLRALRRCISPEGVRYHALDLGCETADPTALRPLAYVR